MSRNLERQIYKELTHSGAKNYSSFVKKVSKLRGIIDPKGYMSLLKPYRDAALKKYKNRSWTGVRDIRDLGYNCVLQSKGVNDDIAFVSQWLAMHTQKLNEFINFSWSLQEEILNENFENALAMAWSFQKASGWSFWILEAIYLLTYKVHGIEETRAFTQTIKAQADKRIIGFAASFLLERVDERYSSDAFHSRWELAITKYVVGRQEQEYYLFRSMGLTPELGPCLGTVLCHDFTGSIYDCYSSLIEAAASFVAEHESESNEAIKNALLLLREVGIKDYRIEKILFYVSGEWLPPVEVPNVNLAEELSACLTNYLPIKHIKLSDLQVIDEINERGISANDSIGRLHKFGFGLRFLPIGLALNEYSNYCTASNVERIVSHPWAALLSPCLELEECFVMSFDAAWGKIKEFSESLSFQTWRAQACQLLQAKSGPFSLTQCDSISRAALVWLAYYFIESERYIECDEIAQLLAEQGGYWKRQSRKIKLSLLCRDYRFSAALDLVSAELKSNEAKSILEYPLGKIFENNSWSDFRYLDPKLVGLIAYYANASLVKSDDDTLYICKMACKKVFDSGDRDKIFDDLPLLSDHEVNIAVAFFSLVWADDNLSLLDFTTSRELMLERLDVLRLLVQFDPEDEDGYVSEIMDITLRDTLWEGLSHIEESRIFVNEAGIARWAEKELKKDFDSWKEINTISGADTLIEKLLEYTHSPTSERLEEISGTELTEDNKLLLSIVERLESKFLNDPLDGLRCYLSARIRHGTIKNSYLGPIDESGFLVVKGRLDESIGRYLVPISLEDVERVVRPALIELSNALVSLIDEVLANKLRIKSDRYPLGYIEIAHDSKLFGRIAAALGAKLEFNHFVSVAFSIFWKLLEPSLHRLANFFYDEFQSKTHSAFDQAIEKIEFIGEDARLLIGALTRIKNATCQKCTVAANWFRPGSHPTDRVFSLQETIDIAIKASKNIYSRFNAEINISGSEECLSLKMSAVGMAALVECLNTLFENCWKYSGLADVQYKIDVSVEFDSEHGIIKVSIDNPLSPERESELTASRIEEIRARFQADFEVEAIASEGGTGLPKVSRVTNQIDRNICPVPLDICLVNNSFSVVAYVPIHKRAGAYDVYNY
ncbi:hypothetical protein [Pseudomonas leptonychotis]|uniref:hypothetical protein n=1 Tax=Pseudomonas leptonychotis TaxID=2448482 RepID=UPI0038657C7F